MRRLVIFTAVAACAAALVTAAPAQADPVGTGWTLAFNDDFNGTAVDTAKWNFRTDVKAFSAQRPENVTVAGGLMSINLKQEAYAGKSFTGGGLISKQALRYGYYETRAKINDGVGWHSSYWLMAGDGSTTFGPERRTEIDGFEIDSKSSPTALNTNHSGVHAWNGTSTIDAYHPGSTYNTGLDLRQWHVYGIDWSETSVKFLIDGVLKYTAPYTPAQWTHDYTNIWLTSIGYGTSPDPAFLPTAVQFDYIKYWQRDYYLDNDGPAAYGYSETGTWLASTLNGWNYTSPSRYAACHSAGNTATWRPNLGAAGNYEVFVYKIAAANSDSNVRYDTVHNGVTSTSYVNGTTGTSGWVSLGSYSFAAGTAGSVKLTSSGSGCARADAVKFVRA
ncbi:beta-glucanase (GH16 family) [Allocatelliglobosispora scoriae]|uniref:Beta-glucanase (GH16 family) n=1 Tax=Allocatelliglobosispora scoriae TaxID=643052 RepID=A0A841C5X9_9ACTN|nr:glycoside hydrolase family 16 protein [Allocatelliglobosispora scoriae]MBB5874482.1 beta-glucanase (GH16 family) [Allocatelliglobosispora scoriae]